MELTRYRDAAGFTMTELARRSGVDLSIISRLESGDRDRASYETVLRLARALDLTAEQLQPVDYRTPPRRRRDERTRGERHAGQTLLHRRRNSRRPRHDAADVAPVEKSRAVAVSRRT
jgi:transcriptional regulator with XRE-family HTH domain